MDNAMRDWALYYQKLGLSIIPVKDKTPLILWKEFQTRKANEEEINKWWTQWPTADIGMVTGPISKRIVLDIDGAEGQRTYLDRKDPLTLSVHTKRGMQYHFNWPKSLDEKKTTLARIQKEIDVRGTGGYVKLPPSVRSDGARYTWNDLSQPISDCPQWLLDLLLKEPEVRESNLQIENKESWLEDILDGVGEGERHQALVRLAGYYYNCMNSDVAAQHLREWNKKNRPPYKDKELEEQIVDFTQRFTKGEYSSQYIEQLKQESVISPLSATEVVHKFANRIDYLVDGLIPMASSVIFSGYQGLGKTFVATDLIIEISRKKGNGKWLDTFGTKHGSVLFIDNELGGNLTSYRLRQLISPKGLTTDDLSLYYFIRNRIKITNNNHYRKLCETIEKIHPVLVVIDSFASAHTLDENQSKDMRYFFDELIAPLCDTYKCAVMLVDHETKGSAQYHQAGNKRLRGSGAKGDAVDQVISLDWQDGVLLFEHSKARYQKKHESFKIEIEDVQNGIIVRNSGYITEK